VVAVCDVDGGVPEQKAEEVNKHYGNTDCKAYRDYREVVTREGIDTIMIGTPDHWHADSMSCIACQWLGGSTVSAGPNAEHGKNTGTARTTPPAVRPFWDLRRETDEYERPVRNCSMGLVRYDHHEIL